MSSESIRLSRSIVGQAEAEAVARVIIDDGYLGMGREVEAFETEIAGFLGVPRDWVICVSTGTAALQLALEAVVEPGDKVLVQSLTYLASFQAVSGARAVPIACEVDPRNVTIDLDDAAGRMSAGTAAVMPVHYASNPGDLKAIYDFARQHGLRVVEDAAHAFGCTYQGEPIGSIGDLVCFSFDGIKNITSGEGGAVVTRDPIAAERIRDARLLGVQKDTEKRYQGLRSWEFDVTRQGWRYHMSNIMAAVGRVQLRRLKPEFAPKRRELATLYHERLAGTPHLTLLETDLDEVIPHIQPVRILDGRRDGLKAHLEGLGIPTGFHYQPNHLLRLYGGGQVALPVTEALSRELVSLPLHPGLNAETVNMICDHAIRWLAD
ncbi:MAG: DegT/DnrJ/EryC1/StrS family aminotransferase [Proteobacteria bacterium]|nr:DegT/DnrJ/EryC1/StrS family aminotransferase [Pseudomonadota bacterium]